MSSKISALAALAAVADADLLPMVDVSDTSMAASGTDVQVTAADFQAYTLADIPVFTGGSNPSTPPNGVTLFSRQVAGRQMAAAIGPSGLDTAFQPLLARNAVQMWNAVGGATTVPTAFGAGALSATGTATTLAVSGSNMYTSLRMLEYLVTSASTTAVVGWRAGVNSFIRGSVAGTGGFHLIQRFAVATAGTLSTARFFCGLSSQTGAPTDVEPSTNTTLANTIGIGYDAADTNYQLMTKTGTGTATKVDTGIAKSAGADRTAVFEVALFCPPAGTTISWQLTRLDTGSTASGSTSTTLPAATTALGPICYRSVGGTSSVMGLAFKSLCIETDD